MHIDRKVRPSDEKCWEVAESEVERDLDIWVSNDLKWETQCKKATAQIMSVLGMIRRIFPVVAVDVFKLLYSVLVFILGLHLEFCIQVWSWYFKKDIDCIEKVQRKATQMDYGFWNLKYEERLNLFLL